MISRRSVNYRIFGPMSHFWFRPEVIVVEWLTTHSTRNTRLSYADIRNFTLKMPTSGFITGKPIKRQRSWTHCLFATSASSLLANETKPKPLEPRSLKMISTSFTFPYFSNMARKSGSRNRKGILDTCSRFDSVVFDSSETFQYTSVSRTDNRYTQKGPFSAHTSKFEFFVR